MNPRNKIVKKKKKTSDRAYHPRTAHTNSKTRAFKSNKNTLAMRANTEKNIVDEKGHDIALKTSVIINTNAMTATHKDSDQLNEKLEKGFKSIESHRPIQVIEYSESGSPLKAVTPQKTVLKRDTRLGTLSFFSNRDLTSPKKINLKRSLSHDFFSSQAYHTVQKPEGTVKSQKITITSEQLAETKKKNAENGNVRVISQNQTMVEKGSHAKDASATQYAKSTDLFSENMKWEWLHLVAYKISGASAQKMENMVCGSKHANTDMMLIESELEYLTQKYPEGFQLITKANLIENTQIATTIEYTIQTNDFTLPLVFNAQNPNQPHLAFKDYMHSLVKALVDCCTHRPTP